MTTTILASFPSPSQGVWYLGPVPIRAYALFILIGVIAALFIGNKRWAQRGGEPGVIYDIALWAIIFGLIGGRLYHVLTDWSTYFGPGGAGLVAAFKIQEGGLGIWGAVALGGVGAWIGCRRKGIPLPAFGDAVAPGIVLAQAIGRIGNYFNQELYGRETDLPWGLVIYERRDANGAPDMLNGVSTGVPFLEHPVHPTFLYELLWNLLVFALLIWLDRRYRIGHGRLFAVYVAAYCFGRFWIELMRNDTATLIAGIRINSFVSVFVFIGAVVYIMVAPKGREDPSSLRGDADDGQKLAPDEDEQSPADELTRELAAVAATTGVVAAAKAAGEREDEDAAEAAEENGSEAAEEKPDSAEAEEHEAEAVADTEQPVEDIAEAEAFAEAGEEAEELEVGGVGAVEGDEVVEAQDAAPEVREAAVANAEEAADVADEAAAEVSDEPEEPASEIEGADGEDESTGDEPAQSVDEGTAEEAADVADEVAAEVSDEPEELASEIQGADGEDESTGDEPAQSVDEGTAEEAAEPEVGGVGAVEGDEVVGAQDAAPEVREAAVANAEEAAEVADEVANEEGDEPEEATSETVDAEDEAEQPVDDTTESEGDAEAEGDSVGGVGAVEADEVVEAQDAAPKVHEAAAEGAEEAAEAAAEIADEPDK